MTELAVKYRVGWLLVGSHFVIILGVLALFLAGAFSYDELTTMLAVIVPMFAGYSTSIVSFFVQDRFNKDDKTEAVSPTFMVFSFAFPAVFAGVVLVVIVLKAFNLAFANFEQFKETLVVIEALFAVYVARFVYAMYKE